MLKETKKKDCSKIIWLIVIIGFLFFAFPPVLFIIIFVLIFGKLNITKLIDNLGLKNCLSIDDEKYIEVLNKIEKFKNRASKEEKQSVTYKKPETYKKIDKIKEEINKDDFISLRSDIETKNKSRKPRKVKKIKKIRHKSNSFSSYQKKSVFDDYESVIDLFDKKK